MPRRQDSETCPAGHSTPHLAPQPANSGRDLAHCFLRLTNLDNGAFERLGRYESALARQVTRILFLLKSARVCCENRFCLSGSERTLGSRRPISLGRDGCANRDSGNRPRPPAFICCLRYRRRQPQAGPRLERQRHCSSALRKFQRLSSTYGWHY
jgi:hypothetical protein